MRKNILIVSFTFPPAPGIGGRRWAKFAKYLQRHGHNVHVIAAKNDSPIQSNWVSDVTGVSVSFLPSGQPAIFLRPAISFMDRIRFKLASVWMKIIAKGNYYDKAARFKHQLVAEAKKIIKEKNISHVITSGAPFHLLEYMVTLKPEFPHVKFISDFRDVWTTDNSISNFKSLSKKRFMFEKDLERKVVNGSDVIITVAEPITQYFAGLSQKSGLISETIENGFDPDDFPPSSIPEMQRDDKIRIVFMGTVYPMMDEHWQALVLALSELKIKSPNQYKKLEFNFYGKIQPEYLAFAKKQEVDVIRFHGEVPLKEVYVHIRESTFCLLILHDLFTFTLSTKFCEYVSQHKKTLVLSMDGETARFVESNNLGYWINPGNVMQSLDKIFKDLENGNALEWNPGINISEYSLEVLTLKLEALF